MRLLERTIARRRRKAQERYLRERDRQRALNEQDSGEASRRDSLETAGRLQSGFFP
jgi:hypothetical protein